MEDAVPTLLVGLMIMGKRFIVTPWLPVQYRNAQLSTNRCCPFSLSRPKVRAASWLRRF